MQTIGERLEEARKKKGISIREAAEATKIRGDYITKFESNHFDIGLAEIYTRGFLRTYAGYLKLSSERILNDYAALGRGEVRPRQPNREIYGKMDISVSTAGESSERAEPPKEGADDEPAARAQPRYPRGQGNASMPMGPDPALIFKYAKWAGAAVVVLIVVLAIRALFSGGSKPPAPQQAVQTPTTATTPSQITAYKLRAIGPATVRVNVRLPDDSLGAEVFSGYLAQGETKSVEWRTPQVLWSSALDNLIMINPDGVEIPFRDKNLKGVGQVNFQAPPAR